MPVSELNFILLHFLMIINRKYEYYYFLVKIDCLTSYLVSDTRDKYSGKAADIWALGVTLYCFIFGKVVISFGSASVHMFVCNKLS